MGGASFHRLTATNLTKPECRTRWDRIDQPKSCSVFLSGHVVSKRQQRIDVLRGYPHRVSPCLLSVPAKCKILSAGIERIGVNNSTGTPLFCPAYELNRTVKPPSLSMVTTVRSPMTDGALRHKHVVCPDPAPMTRQSPLRLQHAERVPERVACNLLRELVERVAVVSSCSACSTVPVKVFGHATRSRYPLTSARRQAACCEQLALPRPQAPASPSAAFVTNHLRSDPGTTNRRSRS